MAWSGSLGASCAAGSSITFTPDTTAQGAYTVSAFTAPRRAVYRFVLKGSGGSRYGVSESGASCAQGGAGGMTTGYLLLDAGETVYVGAGGPCSAAFVAKKHASSLAALGAKSSLYFVAGAGGEGGANWGQTYNMKSGTGGAGGGASGGTGTNVNGTPGAAGTQAGGYAFGTGGASVYTNVSDTSLRSGRGGDGLYGGHAGTGADGGGGGSGYVHAASLSVYGSAYANATSQGGGAAGGASGSVAVSCHAEAGLPLLYNGTRVTKLVYNGTQVTRLVYNGTTIF
ncbi:MAG: hypothetical protein J6K32_00305 [Clostridia bacterium]|nr:hypothetical protein [Clostridia bacterium]